MAYCPIGKCPNAEQKARQFNRMNTIRLPTWNSLGFLPPIDEQQPTSTERSPYALVPHVESPAQSSMEELRAIDLAATDDAIAIAQLHYLARQGVAA